MKAYSEEIVRLQVDAFEKIRYTVVDEKAEILPLEVYARVHKECGEKYGYHQITEKV